MKLQSGLGIIQVRFDVFYFTSHIISVESMRSSSPAPSALPARIFESSILGDLVWIHHKAMISAIPVKIMRAARSVLRAGCRVEDRWSGMNCTWLMFCNESEPAR